MGKTLFLTLVLLFISGNILAVGTYLEESDKEGPSAVYELGIISEKQLNVEIDVRNRSGINISYPRDFLFEPGSSDFSYWRNGEYVSGRKVEVNITSVKPDRSVYEIPVALRFYRPGREGSARVVQEREYILFYGTDFERDYGFEGSLISEINGSEEDNVDNRSELKESLSMVESNNTSVGKGEGKRKGSSKITLLLVVLLVLVLVYTVRQLIK